MLNKAYRNSRLLGFIVVYALMMFGQNSSIAQETIFETSAAQEVTTQFPINRYSNYSIWEGLFTPNEFYLNSQLTQLNSGYLNTISFHMQGNFEDDNLSNVKIYVKTTTSTDLSTQGDFSLNGFTLVYDGSLNHLFNDGWVDFKLMYPFYYNNNQNLQIAVMHGLQYSTYKDISWGVYYSESINSRYSYSDEDFNYPMTEANWRPVIRISIGCLWIDPGKNKSICSGESIQLGSDINIIGGGGNYTYEWSPSDYLNDATISNPIASPSSTQEYILNVSSSNCSTQASKSVYLFVSNENSEIRMGQQEVVSLCKGTFTDSNGPDYDYENNEDYKLTIYPCNNLNKVAIIFESFDLESSLNGCDADWLKIYDGNNTNCNLIGTYCGQASIPEIISSHISGALTFEFHSNYEISGNGWNAAISCIDKACDVIAGQATLINNISNVSESEIILNLSGNQGLFNKWQYSYDGIDFYEIDSDSMNLHLYPTITTHYRASVNQNNFQCFSNVVKYIAGRKFYVNDKNEDTENSDIWCQSIGHDYDDGLSINTPVEHLSTIIENYELRAGDVIYIDAGTYTEEILFGPYDYGEPSEKIVIIGAGADGKTKINSNNKLLQFNNTSNIEFRNIYLNYQNADCKTIDILNSSGICINRCLMENTGQIVNISSSNREAGLFSDNIRFFYNVLLQKGEYALNTLHVDAGSNNLIIDKNFFQNEIGENLSNAIAIEGIQDTIIIDSNFITGYQNALYIYGDEDNRMNQLIIKNNFIDNLRSLNADNLVYIKSCNLTNFSYNKIRGGNIIFENTSNVKINNNFISNSVTGISFITEANSVELFHNSMYNSSTNILFSGLDNSSGLYIKNNILYNTSSNSSDNCILMRECTNNIFDVCNFNLYFTPNGASIAKFGSYNHSNLAELKSFDHVLGTSNGDESSITGNPDFYNPENGELGVLPNSIAIGKSNPISSIIDDYYHISRSNSTSIGGGIYPGPTCPNGPFAELKRKLDGGYYLTNSGYLLIKYAEEYNKTNGSKLKYKLFKNNREIILSSISGFGQFDFGGNTSIKYGDNYCSINLWGCGSSTQYFAKTIPIDYYILEVINDKNEKWYLRFKHDFTLPSIWQPWGECLTTQPQIPSTISQNLNNLE